MSDEYMSDEQNETVSGYFKKKKLNKIDYIYGQKSQVSMVTTIIPAGIYLLKVNNRNTRTRCEICLELTMKTPERRHWCRSSVFIVNFEHISYLFLLFLLLTLNM